MDLSTRALIYFTPTSFRFTHHPLPPLSCPRFRKVSRLPARNAQHHACVPDLGNFGGRGSCQDCEINTSRVSRQSPPNCYDRQTRVLSQPLNFTWKDTRCTVDFIIRIRPNSICEFKAMLRSRLRMLVSKEIITCEVYLCILDFNIRINKFISQLV